VPEKGFIDLMDAWARARKTQDWKLIISGDADHEGKYSLA